MSVAPIGSWQMQAAYGKRPRHCPFGWDHELTLAEVDDGVYAVCCSTCSTIGPHNEDGTTPEQAIECWNNRVNEAQ